MFKTPAILPLIYPSLIWKMDDIDKVIYLTFDDGPIPEITPKVLTLLDAYEAKATFFCIGDNIKKHPEVFNSILKKGHSIGNHTFNHLNGWKVSTQQYLENYQLCDELILSMGVKTNLFRPPYGRIKSIQIMALSAKKIVMWDLLTKDYNPKIAPEICLQKTINHSESGSIVVFHDSLKAEKNMLFALPKVLNHFSDIGYQFKSIDMAL